MEMQCDNWQKHGEDAEIEAIVVFNGVQLCEECFGEALEAAS